MVTQNTQSATMNGTTKSSILLFEPASSRREELMTIYAWPFSLVVLYTVFGVIGNALVLYIYIVQMTKTKVRLFIIALGVVNFINSAFNMPTEAYILWHPLDFDNDILCKVTRGTTFVINNICACLFVAIAIDRVLLVFRPIKRHILTGKYVKVSCSLAFLIGTATSWPGFVLYGTATLPEKLDDAIVVGKTCFVSDAFLESNKWPKLFNTILFILMLIIFVMLTVMYILIGRRIYRVTKCDIDDAKINAKRFSKNSTILGSVRKFVVKMVLPDQKIYNVQKATEVTRPTGPSTLRSMSVSFDACDEEGPSSSCRTLSQLPRMSRRISSVNSHASRENTITLTMITIVYMVSFLPYLIVVSLRYFKESFYSDLGKSGKIAYHLFLRTYFLNSVTNPVVYCFVNKAFRRALFRTGRQIFCRFNCAKKLFKYGEDNAEGHE